MTQPEPGAKALPDTLTAPTVALTTGQKRRNAMVASYQGFFLDFIDIYLPVIALAPAMAYFFSSELSPAESTILFYLSITATLIGRPVGSAIFGSVADRIGRRAVTMVAVAGFTLCTLLIALLPGYATWGIAAPLLLVFLRFVDGIFLGAEYTAATPLAYEYCPKEKRGLFGGVLQTAYPFAWVVMTLATLAMLQIAPAGDETSAYSTWGWRVPFLASVLLSTAFLVYRVRNLPESEVWEEGTKAKKPVREILFGAQRRHFWQIFLLMTGLWMISIGTTTVIPTMLNTFHTIGSSAAQVTLLCANAVLIVAYVVAGAAGQRFGRRKFLMYYSLFAGLVSAGLWFAFAQHGQSVLVVAILAGLITVIAQSTFGVITAYLNERFQTSLRSSGFGLGYGLAVILPGLYGFYSVALGNIMPIEMVPVLLYVVGGMLTFVAAKAGPETNDVDIRPTLSAAHNGQRTGTSAQPAV